LLGHVDLQEPIPLRYAKDGGTANTTWQSHDGIAIPHF
jgi:hypothetical protein